MDQDTHKVAQTSLTGDMTHIPDPEEKPGIFPTSP